jgi:predicted metal-dependent hydrolase
VSDWNHSAFYGQEVRVRRPEQASFPFDPGQRPRPALAPRLAARPSPMPLESGGGEAARQELEHRIAQHVNIPGARLALAVTDNRYTMISVKREKGLYRLRLHHMFLEAEPEVVRALGRYVAKNDRDASRLLGQFIDINQRKIRRTRRHRLREPAPVTIETRGEVYDLQDIYDDLNLRYFADCIDARITWGQRNPPGAKRRRRNSIKMGSYSVEDRLIRIHPSLDRPFVPREFVEWIVYHEMLHQKHDIPVIGGRRIFHTEEFMAEEASFEHYEPSRQWERDNLDRLLHY